MSETARALFESLKETVQAIAPGLQDLIPEVKAELFRLKTQGAMEFASALLGNGSAFVPYGPGQYTPTPERTPERGPAAHEHEMER